MKNKHCSIAKNTKTFTDKQDVISFISDWYLDSLVILTVKKTFATNTISDHSNSILK